MTDASSLTRLSLSRRGLLGCMAAAGGGVVLGGSPRAASAQSKFSQSMARYQPTPKGSARCDGCVQWQGPASCKLVDGVISPSGWCFLYAAKSKS